MAFEKGNSLGGRKKGSKNRLTNDVRQVFHRVYDEMGADAKHEKTGKPLTGHEAMLLWARDNQSEFYRLYGKMIPQTAELGGDLHEDFVDDLIFAEEQPRLVDAKDVTDVGKEGQKQLPSGETSTDIEPNNADNAPLKDDDDYMP